MRVSGETVLAFYLIFCNVLDEVLSNVDANFLRGENVRQRLRSVVEASDPMNSVTSNLVLFGHLGGDTTAWQLTLPEAVETSGGVKEVFGPDEDELVCSDLCPPRLERAASTLSELLTT